MNTKEILELNPTLVKLINRLDKSVTEIDAKNKAGKIAADKIGSSHIIQYPEHFTIDLLYNNGNWESDGNPPQASGDALRQEIDSISLNDSIAAFEVKIFNGKTSKKQLAKYTTYLKEGVKPPNLGTANEQQINELDKRNEDMQKTLSDAMELFKKQNPNDMQMTLMSQKFEISSLTNKHELAMERLKMTHERELDKKDREIEKLSEELDEMQEALNDRDAELNGIEDEVKEKLAEKNSIAGFLGEALSHLIEETEFGKKLIGNKKILASDQPDNNENVTDKLDLSGLEENHQKGLREIITVLQNVDFNNFLPVYQLLMSVANEDAKSFNIEKVKQAIQAAKTA